MAITPKKLAILAIIGIAAYFGYTFFRSTFSSKTNEELFAMYAEGGAKAAGARTELEIRVAQGKIQPGDLMSRVNDASVDSAELALSLLARMKHKDGIGTYIAKVKMRDPKRWRVNAAAADALKATRCPKSREAIQPLIDLLKWEIPDKDGVLGKDATEKVRSAAGAALETITGENHQNNASAWEVWWQGAQREFQVKD